MLIGINIYKVCTESLDHGPYFSVLPFTVQCHKILFKFAFKIKIILSNALFTVVDFRFDLFCLHVRDTQSMNNEQGHVQ